MPDPYRLYSKGSPVPRDAGTFNAFAAGARMARDSGAGLSAGTGAQFRQGSIVRVKNETGGPLLRFSVVGLGAPLFLPSDSEDAFLREVTFRATTPNESDHRGKFGILLEPAVENQVVRAWVAGVAQVQVDVTDSGHTCCDAGNDTDKLVSSGTGSAQILWREGGTGVQWAVIRFGYTCAGPMSYG